MLQNKIKVNKFDIFSFLIIILTFGLDRIIMLLANQKNIREITLFPMNQNAQDLMMQAPSEVEEEQLKELGIKLDLKKS